MFEIKDDKYIVESGNGNVRRVGHDGGWLHIFEDDKHKYYAELVSYDDDGNRVYRINPRLTFLKGSKSGS